MDPGRPPVTVSVPGRGGGPAEVLTAGPLRDRPAGPRWARGAAAATGAVLVGVLALDQDQELSPPAPLAAPSAAPARSAPPVAVPATAGRGVAAAVALRRVGPDAPYVERLLVTVALDGRDLEGDRPGRRHGEQVTLLDLAAPGFAVALPGRSLPVAVGVLDPTSAEAVVVRLPADVVVSDCAVERLAPRRVVLTVARGDGPPELLPAEVARPVVRVLDRLVSRTCRRPDG